MATYVPEYGYVYVYVYVYIVYPWRAIGYPTAMIRSTSPRAREVRHFSDNIATIHGNVILKRSFKQTLGVMR